MARAKSSPAKRPNKGVGTSVHVRFAPELLAAVDGWAKSQDRPLSRPEAIRQLTSMAIADRRQKPR